MRRSSVHSSISRASCGGTPGTPWSPAAGSTPSVDPTAPAWDYREIVLSGPLSLPTVDALALEALRIAAWRPDIRDTDEKSIPHEFDWLRSAVHLSKGCYRGRETVAKVHNLGHPPRRLVLLHLDGVLPAAGDEVLRRSSEDETPASIGRITSAAVHYELGPIALAVVKRSTPVDADLAVLIDGIPVAAAQEGDRAARRRLGRRHPAHSPPRRDPAPHRHRWLRASRRRASRHHPPHGRAASRNRTAEEARAPGAPPHLDQGRCSPRLGVDPRRAPDHGRRGRLLRDRPLGVRAPGAAHRRHGDHHIPRPGSRRPTEEGAGDRARRDASASPSPKLIVLLVGKGPWQLAIVLLATLVVARAVSPQPAFAMAAAVQSVLVVLLPDPEGGPFTRSLDAVIAGVVALVVTALIPRNPRRATLVDARATFSVLRESAGGLVDALNDGSAPAAELARERLLRTDALVEDWRTSLESATAIARISPWLRRQLPEFRKQAEMLNAADLAARHFRTIARRVIVIVRDGSKHPDLAGLIAELSNAVQLLSTEIEDRAAVGAARTALADVAARLDPTVFAPVRELARVPRGRPGAADGRGSAGCNGHGPRASAGALLPDMR